MEKKYKKDLEKLGLEEVDVFEVEGIRCLIRRHHKGYLNGYIRINDNHSFTEDEADDLFKVHGGITFIGSWKDEDVQKFGSCYAGKFLGFTCCFGDDWTPDYPEGIYRDYDYVKQEITNLAQQYADFCKK